MSKDKQVELVQETKPAFSGMNPEVLIGQAIANNVPVEIMERLLAMRKELKAEQAKEAFDEAMSKAQAEFPIIRKNKDGGKTKSGKVAYKYASTEDIAEEVNPIIAKNDLSYKFETETLVDGKVRATCIVKHKLGHSEPSSVEMPIGQKTDIMSAPQSVAATITFAKRYAFINAFGIVVGDEDTDAIGVDLQADIDTIASVKGKISYCLRELGVKTTDKTKILDSILALTQLDGDTEDHKQLEEIKSRLEVLVKESKQN